MQEFSKAMVKSSLSTLELKEHLARQPKQLPVSCLYDKRGSDLYEEITALPEYYPFNEELNLLKAKANEIIAHIPAGSIILELGCGSTAKTGTILNAIAHRWASASSISRPDVCRRTDSFQHSACL